MFPIPTAEPMQARMNPHRLAKESREWFFFKVYYPFFPRNLSAYSFYGMRKAAVCQSLSASFPAFARDILMCRKITKRLIYTLRNKK